MASTQEQIPLESIEAARFENGIEEAIPESKEQGPVYDEIHPAPLSVRNVIEFAHEGGATRRDRAARMDMEQQHLIPLATAQLPPVRRFEKWSFMVFRMSVGGVAISTYGTARFQQLINYQFPKGKMPFAGSIIPVNSYLTNLTGFKFAAQFVALMLIGPYVDYGTWRPWLLIFFEVVTYICCIILAILTKPSQWLAATAICALGNIALNIANVFYYATFPLIVKNLPEVLESEREVFAGQKSPEEHSKFHSLSRAKFYNYCIVVASTMNLILLAAATGIADALGNKTAAQKEHGYTWLIVFFTILEILFVSPYLYIFLKNPRPGQRVPDGTPFYLAGAKQAWQAVKYVKDLRQFGLYLIGYFIIEESFGGSSTIQTILQNEVIAFSPLQSTLLSGLGFLTGATGTLFINWVQQRFKFSNKTILLWGGLMILFLKLWGAIGSLTNVIGFHHAWEFYFSGAWNFMEASWNSYYVVLCADLVPPTKMYMFFSLLNVVGETSGFTGPFISAAVIERAGGNTNMAFWYILGTGIIGFTLICFVNVEKAKIDVARYLEREAEQLYSQEAQIETKEFRLKE